MTRLDEPLDMCDELPSQVIDAMVARLGGWRGATLAGLRTLIKQADPDVVEELKWKKPTNPTGVPVWSDAGTICTGEVYKDHVKLTFAKGAQLDDPDSLFNAGLTGGLRRAVDVYEGDTVDGGAFTALVRAAVALNRATQRTGARRAAGPTGGGRRAHGRWAPRVSEAGSWSLRWAPATATATATGRFAAREHPG